MNTEKAIEFLEKQKNKPEDPVEPNRLGINLILNDIIELLQRGEKFEKIVQDFENRYGRYTIYTGSGTDKNNSYLMDKIKQKYFPKPKPKDTVSMVILNKIEEAIKNFLQDIYHIRAEEEIKERNKGGGLHC